MAYPDSWLNYRVIQEANGELTVREVYYEADPTASTGYRIIGLSATALYLAGEEISDILVDVAKVIEATTKPILVPSLKNGKYEYTELASGQERLDQHHARHGEHTS